jgi:hypothetical protein
MGTVLKTHDVKCPECGADDALDVAATLWVRLTPDGSDADLSHDGSHEWDANSNCLCGCGWQGKVYEARKAAEKAVAE